MEDCNRNDCKFCNPETHDARLSEDIDFQCKRELESFHDMLREGHIMKCNKMGGCVRYIRNENKEFITHMVTFDDEFMTLEVPESTKSYHYGLLSRQGTNPEEVVNLLNNLMIRLNIKNRYQYKCSDAAGNIYVVVSM